MFLEQADHRCWRYHLWRQAELARMLPCVTSCREPASARGGLRDTQRSLPTPTIGWFYAVIGTTFPHSVLNSFWNEISPKHILPSPSSPARGSSKINKKQLRWNKTTYRCKTMHEASDVGKHHLQEETELNPFNYLTTVKEQKLKQKTTHKQYSISLSKPLHFQPFLLMMFTLLALQDLFVSSALSNPCFQHSSLGGIHTDGIYSLCIHVTSSACRWIQLLSTSTCI